jgi:hypothetical protein
MLQIHQASDQGLRYDLSKARFSGARTSWGASVPP